MNNLSERNNLIYMEFKILGLRQKIIAIKYDLSEKYVKQIIGDVRRKEKLNHKEKKMIELIPARTTLFTREERTEFYKQEPILIADARKGDINPLLKFWHDKRELMNERADRRTERLMA